MSSNKHFLHDHTSLVAGSLRSLQQLNPSIILDPSNKVVYTTPPKENPKNVALISGGSGHEPSFGAFVGHGFLHASVAGSIFASPSSEQILSCIRRVASWTDHIFVIVMNYTGDVLNFGLAIEKAKALYPNITLKMLVVGDDVSVPRSRSGKVGRRGIAGTILIQKIAGALAFLGYELQDITRVSQLATENLVSIGVALDKVHVPGRSGDEVASPLKLRSDEVEIGIGIHNEAGCKRVRGRDAELPSVVREMLLELLDTNDTERAFLKSQTRDFVLLVNNLGGLSVLELGSIVSEVTRQVQTQYQIHLVRTYAGTFMSSLNCAGFSMTLLAVTPTGISHSSAELLDEYTLAPGWTAIQQPDVPASMELQEEQHSNNDPISGTQTQSRLICNMPRTILHLQSALVALINAEAEITMFDTIVGDGDCGTTLKRGAEGILELIDIKTPQEVTDMLSSIALTVERTMDGTSGALFSIFVNAMSQYFQLRGDVARQVDIDFWGKSLSYALNVLFSYTPARPGDKTLVDALGPFVHTLIKSHDLEEAASAAVLGAEKTRSMTARLGRAVYVDNAANCIANIPDAGAWGLAKFFEGLSRPCKGHQIN